MVIALFVIVVCDKGLYLLGENKVPVLYVFSENAAFCSELALPNEAKFSHIIHVRFGSGFGGGNSTGIWLLNVLKKLSCELLISDNHYYVERGDLRIFKRFQELAGSKDHKSFKVIRMIPGSIWSNHGDVTWQVIEQWHVRFKKIYFRQAVLWSCNDCYS